MTTIQLLSVRQTVPLEYTPDRICGLFALQVATTFVTALLSIVVIAAVVFLPIRILALQGLPLLVAMVVAMYLFLLWLEQFDLNKDG
jgi:hypothetical protein